jgi:DNA topoisomerase-1
MTTLIVAEKPNVAKRIAEALGNATRKKRGKVSYYVLPDEDVVVASAVGHLYTVRQARPIDRYPFFDITWVSPHTYDKKMSYLKDYVRVLEELAEDADEVVNACDYDIEGSVIGYNAIALACGMDPEKARRMKFSTLTREGLVRSYESMEQTLNFPMVRAGLTRHELDWFWGMNMSKALSTSVKRLTGKYVPLSAGRVQTPTLYFINEKEKEIERFVPTPYWILDIHFQKDGQQVKATYPEKITDREKASAIYKEVNGKDGSVSEVKRTKATKNPPIPMDLGLLQSEAWGNFRFQPKRTQEVAQTLYEAGLISYPRTSSQQYPSDLGFTEILEALKKNPSYAEAAAIVLGTPLKPTKGKKTDPAHPAIYPTGLRPEKLTKDQKRLYDLVVQRFFAVFMPPSVVENITLTVGIESHPFVAKGQRIVEEGWMRFYGPYVRSSTGPLPHFDKGEHVPVDKHEKTKKMTKPPARYNPASVIKEMERLGIGTKATRANTVDILFNRGYIKGREIRITEIGKKLVETLEHYCSEIVSVELTSHFEKEMEQILASEKERVQVLEEAKRDLREIFSHFKEHEREIGSELIEALINSENENLGTCPTCGADLKVITARKTGKRFVGCSNYPTCKTSYPLPQKGTINFAPETCAECGAPMLKGRRGRSSCINMSCPSKEKREEGEREKKEEKEAATKAKQPSEG